MTRDELTSDRFWDAADRCADAFGWALVEGFELGAILWARVADALRWARRKAER